MKKSHHLLLGIWGGLYLSVILSSNYGHLWACFAFTFWFCLGSMFPDVDGSQRTFLRINEPQGVTHSFIGAFLFSWLLSVFVEPFYPEAYLQYTLAFFIGYVLHIVQDMMVMPGVELLWPCKKRFCYVKLDSEKDTTVPWLFTLSFVLASFIFKEQYWEYREIIYEIFIEITANLFTFQHVTLIMIFLMAYLIYSCSMKQYVDAGYPEPEKNTAK